MSEFRDFGQDRDDDLPGRIVAKRSFDGVTIGAGLQAAAHLLYVVFLLVIVFVILAVTTGKLRETEPLPFIFALSGLGLCANWTLSVVAAALLAFADAGTKARGVGLALLAFSGLVVLKLPLLAQLVMAILSRFGGPGGLLDGPSGVFMIAIGLTFFLCEVARVTLVAWYVAAASPSERSGLRVAGVVLGIVTPVLAFLAFLVCVLLLVTMSSTWGFGARSDLQLGLYVLYGIVALTVLVLIFGAVLLMRLGSAVQSRRRLGDF